VLRIPSVLSAPHTICLFNYAFEDDNLEEPGYKMFRYDIALMLSDQLTTGWRENDTSVQRHVYEYRRCTYKSRVLVYYQTVQFIPIENN